MGFYSSSLLVFLSVHGAMSIDFFTTPKCEGTPTPLDEGCYPVVTTHFRCKSFYLYPYPDYPNMRCSMEPDCVENYWVGASDGVYYTQECNSWAGVLDGVPYNSYSANFENGLLMFFRDGECCYDSTTLVLNYNQCHNIFLEMQTTSWNAYDTYIKISQDEDTVWTSFRDEEGCVSSGWGKGCGYEVGECRSCDMQVGGRNYRSFLVHDTDTEGGGGKGILSTNTTLWVRSGDVVSAKEDGTGFYVQFPKTDKE
eukprot:CAMPEP_0201485826 /NCGR_PEP_ID=MMETSP0151_2-20130828/9921_1 /ASSEMBLY_ACC=CAM_ASM_000257 /TAXON_ID=200890 /ORGANISM="Paramoeba atlantica, Strain 621/1 / CCAP 1560/9" /LENGTH=253 /DNA_ID=CAMNT_0047870147 /DNA_START=45 /DNA_END=806 /DNA_ORIENTATION=+